MISSGANISEKGNYPILNYKIKSELIAHILLTRHNTFITISDRRGKIYLSNSVGNLTDMRKGRRSIPIASNFLAHRIGRYLVRRGVKSIYMEFQGDSRKRPHILRGLESLGIKFRGFSERTGIPYNGTRRRHSSRR